MELGSIFSFSRRWDFVGEGRVGREEGVGREEVYGVVELALVFEIYL